MMATPTPRRVSSKSTNCVQRNAYIVSSANRAQSKSTGAAIGSPGLPLDSSSPNTEPAPPPQTNGKFLTQPIANHVVANSNENTASDNGPHRSTSVLTNGTSSTIPSAILPDDPFLVTCKAAYLGVRSSIADDMATPQDLIRALQLAGFNPSRKNILQHWKLSLNGGLTFVQFCDIADVERSRFPDLFQTFRKLDMDNTGFLPCEQLKILLTTKGERMSGEEFDEVFLRSPFCRQGNFDYTAFCEDVKKTASKCRKAAVEALNRQEKQYELNCSTYVIKRKAERDRAKLQSERLADINSRTTAEKCVYSESLISKDWNVCRSKGCFFIVNEEIWSNEFLLQLESRTNVRLSVETLRSERRSFNLDVVVYVIREGDHNCRQLIAVTDKKNANGQVYFEAELEAGRYVLLPYSSGNATNVRVESFGRDGTPNSITAGDTRKQLVMRQKFYRGSDTFEGKPKLTVEYRDALHEMFAIIDLDGNGGLSQREFTLFQKYACGEEITDLDWSTLISNSGSERKEMSLNEFLLMHQMVVELDGGNSADEMWATLTKIGFDKTLELTYAFPYMLSVHTECPNPQLEIDEWKCSGLLERAICRTAIERGRTNKIRNLNDLIANIYTTEYFATIVVQNKSHSCVTVRLDCTSSKNCRSHRGTLDFVLPVSPKSVTIGHHMVKIVDQDKWEINCVESVVK